MMAYETISAAKPAVPTAPHNIIIESRTRMTITGVTDVDSFDEQVVVMYCSTGQLAVRGLKLHINRIDVESGEVNLEGERIDGISYAENSPVRGGFLGKLFR